jgi:hypothetical protein
MAVLTPLGPAAASWSMALAYARISVREAREGRVRPPGPWHESQYRWKKARPNVS